MPLKTIRFSFLIAFLHGVTDISARRCSETLKDEPCKTEGLSPLTLRCDHQTGQFFNIIRVSVEYRPGVWTNVSRLQTLASEECRENRGLDANQEYVCKVTERSLCPFADIMRKVKIVYYCWELDPDLLEGFVPEGEGDPWTDQGGWYK